ncbi:MAG: hypothetical protein VX416_02630 [Pseudomonadota bacterium]|nr:hypothetical protein [Pseudomonadota bacterium]
MKELARVNRKAESTRTYRSYNNKPKISRREVVSYMIPSLNMFIHSMLAE